MQYFFFTFQKIQIFKKKNLKTSKEIFKYFKFLFFFEYF